MNAKLRAAALHRLALATDSIPSEEKVTIYIENTAGFSDDTFTRACRALEKTSSWFPKCAELRAACIEAQPHERPIQWQGEPVSKERAADWLAQIRAAAGIKAPRVKP